MACNRCIILCVVILFISGECVAQSSASSVDKLAINGAGYFEKRGLNVFVFDDRYGLFGDEKASGIEIIHHGVRTATNGDVRLSPTPMQWDSIPEVIRKEVKRESNSVETFLSYPSYHFDYSIRVEVKDSGILITVHLDKPLPAGLAGHAGFNLEFLPAAYFHKTYLMDRSSGILPLYPSGDMQWDKDNQRMEPLPIATGRTLTLAPEDPLHLIAIRSRGQDISLYDGRNEAQNGWFVVRSLIPENKTGDVVEWFLHAYTLPNWIRAPVIAYSQVGYHPDQQKSAIIELDRNDHPRGTAVILKVGENGALSKKFEAPVRRWGNYLRYNYFSFDFSTVKEEGLYMIEYGGQRTTAFRIARNVYDDTWHPTLDIYFPVAMDHVYVKEAYRVWHGASHLDDALQAPPDHVHFDLYAQGPSTDDRYHAFEHIPGLNVGGWFDAGDFDIRTQTQYAVILSMVDSWERFRLTRDETSVDEKTRNVQLHVPDGAPDILQQIGHGILQLMAQQKSVGHAINGIVEGHLSQYTHLGDASTKTDNLVYNPKLDSLASDGFSSGKFDDRWAFTSRSSALNYGSAAAFAAASRALRHYDDTLADECLATAKRIWADEHSHAPYTFRHGNTTGGPLADEELKAAVELLITTGDTAYKNRVYQLLPDIGREFSRDAVWAVKALPYLDGGYRDSLESFTRRYKGQVEKFRTSNPFGLPITTGGWAGNGTIIGYSITNYYLHRAFPDIIDREAVFSGLNYIFGCHPGDNISFASAVGVHSKEIAYGNNRADFTFIAGGVVPGELILHPDFPENKDDWPFLWGENEYVIDVGASYIFLVNAVRELLGEGVAGRSEGTVKLQVDLSHPSDKPLAPIWRFFGYDEANYTYMKDGKKLLTELAGLSPLPVFIRTHNLLTTGNGVPALKWSSTNAYTEDAKGNPVYSWRITDSIFDTYVDRKMKPLVEVGFMPEALSIQPESDKFQTTPDGKKVYHYTGWNYPPRDYEKFGNLVYEWVTHCISRYGKDEVNSWYWEIWNEPDISYWKGTVEEYIKLYDYSVYYIRKALPTARVGGPETTNPSSPRAAAFLKAMLDHIANGNSAVTGKPGVPMDFISFHAKGDPKLVNGTVWMNMGKQLENIDSGFQIVASYPSLRHLPIIIGESDPEGCAACSEDVYPSNAYRNNTMYASYTAASFARVYDLVQSRGVNLLGAVTWAFEFENQPWFRGFRDLATNGVDKPVLNVFRMFGMMKGNRVGVRGNDPDVNGLATFDGTDAYILIWNYHDKNDFSVPASTVTLELKGLKTKQADVTSYIIDQEHSNSYTAWKKMNAPQQPTESQFTALEAAGKLQVSSPVRTIPVDDGRVKLTFNLERQGVTLIKISGKE
jgi:endoglucanase